MIPRISKVRKRDGRLVAFDESKIADAIHKAACAAGTGDRFLSEELAGVVTLFLEKRYAGVPGIEDIQDMVEKVLIETGHARMAKAYILYREAAGPPLHCYRPWLNFEPTMRAWARIVHITVSQSNPGALANRKYQQLSAVRPSARVSGMIVMRDQNRRSRSALRAALMRSGQNRRCRPRRASS